MIIVEHGQGDPNANSFADAEALAFLGTYYRIPVPAQETELERYLLLAADAMNRMRWRGQVLVANQPLPWPRRGITMRNGEILQASHVPYGIEHGQARLAAEMYASDQGLEPFAPTHCYPPKGPEVLVRSTPKFMNHPPLWVESRAQFADYLLDRGLKGV